MATETRLCLHERQSEAFTTIATEVLYGGAAGGGKSHLMRVASIMWCLMVAGLQVVIFRRKYGDLMENHWRGDTSFPALLAHAQKAGECKIIEGRITFKNGSTISLHHCQHEKDVYNHQGAEFHVLIMDELTHFTEFMYRFLRSRCRMNASMRERMAPHLRGLFPRILCGANPGNIGHLWVKRTFVAQGPHTIVKVDKSEGGKLRCFIPAKLSDNPSLDQEEYESTLSGLGDPVLVRAMLDGDWKIVAGAMFGDRWRDNLHVIDPFPIPIDWPIWMGGDDGYYAPASVHWLTKDPNTKTIYVIAELYKAGMLPNEMSEKIKTIQGRIPRWNGRESIPNRDAMRGLMDSAAWADTGASDAHGQKVVTRGAQLVASGIPFQKADKWKDSPMHRAQNLQTLLARNEKDPRGMPGIRFFRHCYMAIETIPALPRDKNDPERVDTDAEDHAFDSVTYGLQYENGGWRRMKVA